MLQLFQSNHMTTLAKILAGRRREFTRGPFDPDTIMVQSFGMGQWLKLKLAEDDGIAANIDCVLPAEFVWRLYRVMLDAEDLPEESPYSRDLLSWHVMRLLPGDDSPEFEPLRHYLAQPGDSQLRWYQLSRQIAGLFDQYLIYRPEWMLAWEQDDDPVAESAMTDQHWQPRLWQWLIGQPALPQRQHRAHLHASLLERLGEQTGPGDKLPRHLSVFGLSALPPMHLDTLRALGQVIDVDIYFLNPCRHYWGDIVSRKDVARRTIRELTTTEGPLTENDYIEVGNPLLSSMGKQGREYLEMLLGVDEISSHDWFVEPDGDNMLDYLKKDVLDLEFGGRFGSDGLPELQTPAGNDRSIQVHACHSKLREVEVLYDELLRIFDDNEDIRPRDVMVMTPNVGEFAPYIHAVFKDKLPYGLADRSLAEESPIFGSFSNLLALPNSRLTSTEVMDFLEVPIIARRFDLTDDDLARLPSLIDESGIRFEVDGRSKQERWDLPPSNQNTWSFGLQRLLTGYAMEDEHYLYRDILPVDVEGDESRLVGILCHFVELLSRYRYTLDQPRSASAWLDLVNDLLADFYSPAVDEELELDAIRHTLDTLVEQTRNAEFDEALSPDLFRHWMECQLEEPLNNRAFLSGGITFGTLIPMRSIPFRVICLMGMNDGEYPRREQPLSFDLMQLAGERRGDRSRRHDDRYLFLEALLSAERYFYISYEGRSLKDNEEKAPSVLVSELIDYTQAVFGRDCRIEHPLQPFNEGYFDDEVPALHSYRREWYEALTNPRESKPFVEVPLEPEEAQTTLDLDALVRFFYNPARYFLRQRLGVYFDDDEIALGETEVFSPGPLEKYQLSSSALAHMIEGIPADQWQRLMVASGQVMDNAVGQQHLAAEYDKAVKVYEQIGDTITLTAETISARLDLDDIELTGRVENIYGETLLDFRTGKLRHRQLLQAWVRHLFLNAAGFTIETRMPNTRKEAKFEPVSREFALDNLRRLKDHYFDGLCRPLPLLPEMSVTYAQALMKGEAPAAARVQALKAWATGREGSERMDRNYQRCFEFPGDFDDDFHQIATAVAFPLLEVLGQ